MTTAWHMTLNQKACGCKRRYMKSVLGTTVSAFRRIIGTRCHFVDKRRERSGWGAGGRQWRYVVRSAGILLEDLLIHFQVLHLLILSTFFGSSWDSCWGGLLPAHLKDQSHTGTRSTEVQRSVCVHLLFGKRLPPTLQETSPEMTEERELSAISPQSQMFS